MPQVRLARLAQREFEEILDYLRASSPVAARRVGLSIEAKIDLIARFPQIGPLAAAHAGVEYRRTVAANYVIPWPA